MSRMRAITQGIQHQNVQAFQQRPTCFGYLVGVRAVGHVANSQAEDVEVGPVLEANWNQPRAQHFKRSVCDTTQDQLGNSAFVRRLPILKRVVKCLPDALLNNLLAIDRQRMIQIKLEDSHVIQPNDVVRVFMGVHDRVHNTHTLP